MKDNIVVVFSSHLSDDENNEFIKHISSTIGVKHEVVCYRNFNEYSLPQIYNKAIDEYNNENAIMVFCHNDIQLKTKNWGRILLNKFNYNNYQILGVAGSKYLPPSAMWWEDRTKMFGIVEHTDGMKSWVSEYSKDNKAIIEPVVLIDGLFMAVDCNDIEHRWDEEFKGFHFYDLSFCIPNYLDGCNIGVITNIKILHNSIGQTNEQWELNRQQFAKKYEYELPMSIFPDFEDLNNITLTDKPKVSVIIPTKNNLKYISNNIYSWQDVVKYDNYEIIIADTGSEESVINAYSDFLSERVKLLKYDYYNFGKINNDVVNNHVSDDTEIIVFCNDDILLLNDVLSRCVQIYNENKNTVGTIGIRLHYGNGNIQHNGIKLYRDENNLMRISHVDIGMPENYKKDVNYNSKGNTGAFLMINKELFLKYSGFNESYIECFEDVELNLNCVLSGLNNITVSDAVAYHYESVLRQKDENKLNKQGVDYTERLYPFYLKNREILDNHIKKMGRY